MLTFAIGDIHGRLDLLRKAVDEISAYAAFRGAGASYRVVCLGDYVDRGPDSKGVVDTLRGLVEGGSWICLAGNHEDMMIRALNSTDTGEVDRWLANGGRQTLESYNHRTPAAHCEWLAGLPLTYRDTHRLYVHAGVLPDRPIEAQDRRSLLWIRERFLEAKPDALPCHIVHGHTPQWRLKPDPALPERLPHRTNLDTGAFMTGVLTVGVFDDARAGGPISVLRIRANPL